MGHRPVDNQTADKINQPAGSSSRCGGAEYPRGKTRGSPILNLATTRNLEWGTRKSHHSATSRQDLNFAMCAKFEQAPKNPTPSTRQFFAILLGCRKLTLDVLSCSRKLALQSSPPPRLFV